MCRSSFLLMRRPVLGLEYKMMIVVPILFVCYVQLLQLQLPTRYIVSSLTPLLLSSRHSTRLAMPPFLQRSVSSRSYDDRSSISLSSTRKMMVSFGSDNNNNNNNAQQQGADTSISTTTTTANDTPVVVASTYIPLDDVVLYYNDESIRCDTDNIVPPKVLLKSDNDYNSMGTTTTTSTTNNNSNNVNVNDEEDEEERKATLRSNILTTSLIIVPILTPMLAFVTFESFAKAFSTFNDYLSRDNNWVAVDGGAYQARIIAPAINGLVVPAVALLFATLISTTISTLRQRQIDIRLAINMEACELRAMECLVDAIPPGFVQDQCRAYLIQYTSRILSECHRNLGAGNDVINPRRGFDSELNGFTRQLNMAHGTVIPSHVADELYASVTRLRDQRTIRISALQSVYPPLHYVLLFVLAFAECVAYLIETDQDILVFLNAPQLKILWSMLVGTFVACFAVVLDLRTPFTGSYQISPSVEQLHTIKLTLQASSVMAAQKRQQQQQQQQNISNEQNEDDDDDDDDDAILNTKVKVVNGQTHAKD